MKIFAIIAASMLTLVGCRSNRTSVAPSSSVQADMLKSQSDARVELRSILASYADWQRLRVPVTVSVSKPKQISISGTAFFERGKSISITLKYFGFEIGSLYVDNDSIMVIDKLHKSFACESVGRFLAGFDVSVDNLQNLLLGHVFVLGKDNAAIDDFSKAEMEVISADSWLLIPPSPSSALSYGFSFEPAAVLKALIVQSGANPPVTCMYGTSRLTAFGPMAESVGISYAKGKTTIDAELQWNFDKAKWDKDVQSRQKSVPSGYRRITSAEISTMISKL
ncbi:MAG: DUF4292 domain-containing protein [Bacteroides sp.]|nr:DUF4292 domain-containing protein [Bacteroides sp.]